MELAFVKILYLFSVAHLLCVSRGNPLTFNLQADFHKQPHKEGFFAHMEKKLADAVMPSMEGVLESCTTCKLAVDLLKELAEKSSDIMGALDWICTHFQIETAEVCEGLKSLFKVHLKTYIYIFTVLKNY